ncbi:MAG: class I SAM-dependent methyltransferase [Isosphaeraceae bacterium]
MPTCSPQTRQYVRVGDGGSEVLGSGDFTALNRSPYDRIAALYAENQAHNQSGNERWFSALERSFLASVPAEGLVADLGCGPGSDGARFAGEGYRVVGMDLSAGRESQPDASMAGLRRRDLRRLPLVSGRLDGIWCVAAPACT